VAVRVQVVGGSSTVYYLHSDHLGSTTALSTSAVGGGLVSGSTARYYPFGAWRTTPTQTLTDRGYTGHLENMEIGLVYMRARYYVPAIGRFASADTIVPEPADPQSFNRYSYVNNSPLNFVDPTGRRPEGECGTGWDCRPPKPKPPTPVVAFEADTGEEWTQAEMNVVENAALDVGAALARIHNRDQWFFWRAGDIDGYRPITARRAFLLVYGGPVHFVRKSFECAEGCFGRSISTQEIWVYQNAVVRDERFIVHELGHGFENALGAITGSKPPRATLARIQSSDPNFPNRFVTGQEPPYGFAGPFPGWQQSRDESAGEEFADMYIGWTYNTWHQGSAGRQRASFMSTNMPLWVDMTLTH
jgi:RHS repeat-associated protein